MRAIILMFDSLNRHVLAPYAETVVHAPNFARLAQRSVTFDNFYAGSMPCMPARREMHTGRYNFLHRSWGPLEPFDDSMPEILGKNGVHTHLISDHPHYWEDGGGTYHTRYTTWEFLRGQEGDPWKAVVAGSHPDGSVPVRMYSQDQVNRSYMPTEAEHVQTRTVDAGLEFLSVNHDADQWMLQLELFDPHEPFFTHQDYKDLYDLNDDNLQSDWPRYSKVTQSQTVVDQTRRAYAALVSMCDRSLGRVLKAMDDFDMWKDTMLIVNTDHGFLLGEHGWWAKSIQPWFNELVHVPMFMWDPRTAGMDQRRGALAQTIDIAPTVLRYFDIEPTPDMQGSDLALVLESDEQIRQGALFGIHGGHASVTDGRYVYMRGAVDQSNGPLEEFTLMPTHMRTRFDVQELPEWTAHPPFSFTKSTNVMRIPTRSTWLNPWRFGTMLFDLVEDPRQETPLMDVDTEMAMCQLLVDLMRANDAPDSQFERLGLPMMGPVTRDHMRCQEDALRVAEFAVPLGDLAELQTGDLLRRSVEELRNDSRLLPVLERHVGEFVQTEQITLPPNTSLVDLASVAIISAETLHLIDTEIAALPNK